LLLAAAFVLGAVAAILVPRLVRLGTALGSLLARRAPEGL
jgi:hypothetical protein